MLNYCPFSSSFPKSAFFQQVCGDAVCWQVRWWEGTFRFMLFQTWFKQFFEGCFIVKGSYFFSFIVQLLLLVVTISGERGTFLCFKQVFERCLCFANTWWWVQVWLAFLIMEVKKDQWTSWLYSSCGGRIPYRILRDLPMYLDTWGGCWNRADFKVCIRWVPGWFYWPLGWRFADETRGVCILPDRRGCCLWYRSLSLWSPSFIPCLTFQFKFYYLTSTNIINEPLN